ncbi:hypothetical protein EJ04DRAFT_504470 [Polyplosphaeria fusca]|uniref:Uncharacterized protein n=1 Tax=Polyplosphaeria fusca TaxID=682080 RepID=A0A9P4UXH6_9PLEO|nr:hypothetical protein EJ04DRAFT_504470 [Polyplosphaeria fusca]
MGPLPRRDLASERPENFPKPKEADALILEAWAQGYMVGSLIIMAFITLANMRRGNLLHKLILGIWQGFWMFFHPPVDAWWLSVSAIFLNASWSLHNVVAWMKIKPFLSRPVSLIFIGTVILAQPFWVLEIYANFAYFHNINNLFLKTRPWEALCRDPWWIFTTVALFWIIKNRYEITFAEIIKISPRFGIMLGAMVLSIIFIVLDILSVVKVLKTGTVGINPFWKLSFVFKCLTDSVILDDFKTALDRLRAFKISRIGSWSQDASDRRSGNGTALMNAWEDMAAEAARRPRQVLPSPDGDYVHASHFPGLKPHRQHKEHKDSVIAPEKRDDSSQSLGLEDIVPSALVDPLPRSMEHAHISEKNGQSWEGMKQSNERHLINEFDYASALRDVHGHSPSTSPTKSSFSRRPSIPP